MKNHFVVAVYSDPKKVRNAVEKLLEAGLSKSALSLISRKNESGVEKVEIEKVNEDAKVWMEQGALWGGLLGLFLGGALFIVPGFGPLVGAGPLTAALAGMLGGALTGAGLLGLADALVEWGMGEAQAKRLEELAEEGKILLIVHGKGETAQQAAQILEETSPEKLETH